MSLTAPEIIFLIITALANLCMVGVFGFRIVGKPQHERRVGVVFMLLALPFAVLLVIFITEGYPAWYSAYVAGFLLFVTVELVLDFILRIPFRQDLRIVVPYVVLFWIVFMGLAGVAFDISLGWGVVIFVIFAAQMSMGIYARRFEKPDSETE